MASRESTAPSFAIELQYQGEEYCAIAGIDEAGRGALAGPLYVGLVMFPSQFYINPPEKIFSLRDSKDLTHKARLYNVEIINEYSVLSLTHRVSPEIIDKHNVNQATRIAIEQMLESLKSKPDCLLLDGTFSFNTKYNLISIKYGDSLSCSIAAASILAKVARDKEMVEYDSLYPEYLFAKNKGYGTKQHRDAIEKHGPCEIHRQSYEPVKSMVKKML